MKPFVRNGLILAMAAALMACDSSSSNSDNSGGATADKRPDQSSIYHAHFYNCANGSVPDHQAAISRLCGIHDITFKHDGSKGKLQIFGSPVDYTPVFGYNPGITHFQIMMPNDYGMESEYDSYYNDTVRYYSESFTTSDIANKEEYEPHISAHKENGTTIFTITQEEQPQWPYAGRIVEFSLHFTPGASLQQDSIKGTLKVNDVTVSFTGKGKPFRSNRASDYLIPRPVL